MDGTEAIARMTGLSEWEVQREVWRARRRSEPDAREVYGLIGGRRFVARRGSGETGAWRVSLQGRGGPWERRDNA